MIAKPQKNRFIRYSQWVPSRQWGARKLIALNGDLSVVVETLKQLGVNFEVREKDGHFRNVPLKQRAVFADRRQLLQLGITAFWSVNGDSTGTVVCYPDSIPPLAETDNIP